MDVTAGAAVRAATERKKYKKYSSAIYGIF